jgi:DNA-binding LacI/PurR family transcriptional regulator
VPKDTMGRLAAERLIALIDGDGGPWAAPAVTGELVIRGTCGGAPPTRRVEASGRPATTREGA